MKVLHLIDSGGLYGAEKMLLALVKAQLDQGLEPMILSAGEPNIEEKPLEAEAKRLGLPIISWRMTPGINIVESWKILKWARSNGFHLLHSHGFKFNVLIGLIPRFLREIPVISTLHGYVHAKRFSKLWFYELLDRAAIRYVDGIVLVSEMTRKELPKKNRHSKNVEVISNGVDLFELSKRAGESIPEDIQAFVSGAVPLLLGVGRLSREKGFDLLVESFAEVKNVYPEAGLLLVGEGKQRPALEAKINALELTKSVLMPGYMDCVPALLHQADVLAMPSTTEGLPITLLEAVGLGCPVIASPVGDIPLVLKKVDAGTLLKERSPGVLATEILRTLRHSEESKRRAKEATLRIHSFYSASAMAESYLSVYTRRTYKRQV
ncbi:glycosyltransferase [Marinobacter sp. NSM]|uniref:glycosyltransferase n=1 Tax=Marinobacter sp. NSM TaxID=3458004 RepID=UPI004037446C